MKRGLPQEACIPMPKKSRMRQWGRHRYFVLLSTFPNKKDAERVAEGLIEKKLAACCSLIPGLSSFFIWEGKKERAKEFLLLMKVEKSCLQKLHAFLKRHHPYEVPELIGLPVTTGDSSYLTWVEKSCR